MASKALTQMFTDAYWGERYFQMRDPEGYEIVFATPIT